MRNLIVVVLVVLVAVGALGYWRGWFSLGEKGNVDVQVSSSKFEQDNEAFNKTVRDNANSIKDQIASLWEKSEGLTNDEKAQVQVELGELKKKHDRLEQQIKEIEDASQDKFESIKQDLSKTLEEVVSKIEELKRKMDMGKNK